MSRKLLKFDWTAVVHCGVQTLAIVPNFDVFKDCCSGQGPTSKLSGHTFGFQTAEETFHDRIIVTIPYPTYTQGGHKLRFFEEGKRNLGPWVLSVVHERA
jgi:hypothetical protein